jgi:hypothetical protein
VNNWRIIWLAAFRALRGGRALRLAGDRLAPEPEPIARHYHALTPATLKGATVSTPLRRLNWVRLRRLHRRLKRAAPKAAEDRGVAIQRLTFPAASGRDTAGELQPMARYFDRAARMSGGDKSKPSSSLPHQLLAS